MKYCMSGRQPLSVLKKCDEVKVAYEDRDKIIDYLDSLSEKTIILEIPSNISEELDWKILQVYAEKVRFILCLHNLNFVADCKAHNIDFYWSYPITNYYELKGVIDLNPCYIFLGAPLSFDLPRVKKITNIPIRLCPNVAYDNYIPRKNGLLGSWIRPEDFQVYDQYVDTYEFLFNDLKHEQTLFHVYAENQNWPGNLNLLLTNFNINIDNRAVPEEIGKARSECGQRCLSGSRCRLCERCVEFATTIHKKRKDNEEN